MKKLFLSLLVALCGAVSLYADDVAGVADAAEAARIAKAAEIAEVKAVVAKEFEFGAKGDFAGALDLYALDYRQTTRNGGTYNYVQVGWLFLALDGKHPAEFWLFAWSALRDGAMPSAEEQARMRAMARTPKGRETYEETLPQVIAAVRAEAALGLRTLKFVSVEVDGGRAVAVIEYDSKRENGAIKTEIGTIDLRKINGEWKFYRCVYKDK